jgi:NAD(P)-dependent dehydrogenase (short-subunit alcohol dehydrogenase family)
MADCDRFVKLLHDNHGGVDFLINNAGRSIRRAIESSYDRFHDFERTMQLNYFGCLRVTMGLLPGMVAKKKGHVVNISSIGVLTNAPRFSAYVASKAALDAWTRCASSEFADQGISFTTINMPLVRTPMIAPTGLYNNVPTLSARGSRRHDRPGLHLQAGAHRHPPGHHRAGAACLVPRVAQIVMNTSFRMFPDSSRQGRQAGREAGQAAVVGR